MTKVSPASFDESVGLCLSFIELGESFCLFAAFSGSSFSLTEIRELSPVSRDVVETILFGDEEEKASFLVNEDESPLAVDGKSSLVDEGEPALEVEVVVPLAGGEESPLNVEEESSLADDKESFLAVEGEPFVVDEGGFRFGEDLGESPLADEKEVPLDVVEESPLADKEESPLADEAEPFNPFSHEGVFRLVDEEEFTLEDLGESPLTNDEALPLDDEEESFLGEGESPLDDEEEFLLTKGFVAVSFSFIESLGSTFDFILTIFFSPPSRGFEADADVGFVPFSSFSVTTVSSFPFLFNSILLSAVSLSVEASFLSSDRVTFRGFLLFLPLFPLGLAEEGLVFSCDISLKSFLFVSCEVLLP